MCNFWTCIITRTGSIVWDKKTSSHEELIRKAKLKDDKLEDRDFVRIEISPSEGALWRKTREGWLLKVDEEKTLPEWFTANRSKNEEFCWNAWEEAMNKTLWQLQVEKVPELLQEIKSIKYYLS